MRTVLSLPESEMGCKLAQRLAYANVVDFIGVSDELQHSGDTRAEKLGRQIAGAA